jgi:hypothetical protein
MTENKHSDENDNRPVSKIKDRIIGIMILVIPWILIIAWGVNEFRQNEEKAKKKNECFEKNCHEQKVKGEIYCSYHLWQADQAFKQHEQELADRNKKVNENKKKVNSYTNSGITNTGKSKSNSKKYKINDPMDYDSPEDYADDAGGVDFEDWDAAYDYWEDIMD